MPVILHPDDYEAWLDDDVRKIDLLKELLRPYPAREMTGHPVGPLVNNARSHGEQLIKRVPVNSL
jgi:putative SOS response-associated peptidase YedK